jgi:Flp pilus assembly protein TadG
MVEFALVLPLLLIVLFLVIDFGVGLSRWIVVTNAARDGARYGAVYTGSDPTGDIKNRVIDASDGILDASNVAVGYVDEDGGGIAVGDSVVVEVDYKYNFITPVGRFLSGVIDSLCLTSSSDYYLEQVPEITPALVPTECN